MPSSSEIRSPALTLSAIRASSGSVLVALTSGDAKTSDMGVWIAGAKLSVRYQVLSVKIQPFGFNV
jgi:hypothetical protein